MSLSKGGPKCKHSCVVFTHYCIMPFAQEVVEMFILMMCNCVTANDILALSSDCKPVMY